MDTLETAGISVVQAKPKTTGKIFGIGLYKTGTSSLHRALTILGFRSFHDVLFYIRERAKNEDTLFPKSILDHYNAFGDHPFPAHFKEVDQEYPNSKFILTVRDIDSWLKSVKQHVKRNRFNPFYRGKFNRYDEAKETSRWHQHTEEVIGYFKDRSQDLLIMNIIEGDGWEGLCVFLNLPVPPVPFPHWNRNVGVPKHLINIFYKWIAGKFKKYIKRQKAKLKFISS